MEWIIKNPVCYWYLMPFLSEAVEASRCYFFWNWLMKFKCPHLLKPLGTIILQNYWFFYPSEPFGFVHFNMIYPVVCCLIWGSAHRVIYMFTWMPTRKHIGFNHLLQRLIPIDILFHISGVLVAAWRYPFVDHRAVNLHVRHEIQSNSQALFWRLLAADQTHNA